MGISQETLRVGCCWPGRVGQSCGWFLLWHILEPSLSKGKVSDSCVCLQLALSFGKHCHSELWEGCHLCSELLVTACVIQLLLIWYRIDRKSPCFEAEGNKG